MRFFRDRATPPLPAVPDGTRVYAIGDIHGRDDLLSSLLETVRADAARRGDAEIVVILLGDLIDRGPDSARVIELAMTPLGWADLHTLRGNHEAALLDALDGDPQMLGLWLGNGGVAALQSWGLDPTALNDKAEIEVCEMIRAAIPADQLDWLRDRPLSLRIGDYVFVHAGIRPRIPLDQQSPHDMLWIRDDFLKSRRSHEAMVVHGHSITAEVDERSNRIGLDTGAYLTGRLTAMGFEGVARWSLATGS